MVNLQNLNNILRSSLNLQPVKTPLSNQADARKNASNISFKGANGLSGANLTPLKNDTISFTGHGLTTDKVTKSDASDIGYITPPPPLAPDIIDSLSREPSEKETGRAGDEAEPSYYDNSVKNMTPTAYSLYREMHPLASDLHQQAKKLENAFNIKMCIFDCLLNDSGKKSKKGPLASKTIRVKKASSIAKKLASKAADLKEKNGNCGVIITPMIAKNEIHDFFGTRLILKNGTIGETNAVINQLINSLNSGNGPKIKTIKNYGKDYKYLSSSKLEELEKAVVGAGYKHPSVISQKKSSGYTATHIIVEVGNGMDGEIQILGRGVYRVKEVDDVCYKGMQGKAMKGFGEISKELKKIGNDPVKTMQYNEYITTAYDLAKKEWDKMPDNELTAQKFPKIDTAKFPKCLDLNNIEVAMKENVSHKDN